MRSLLSSAASTATVLPFSVFSLPNNDMITFRRRSDVMSGLSNKPGGASSIHGCVRPCVIEDPMLVARHAELGVTGEVDEHTHDRERVLVLGCGSADAERARLGARDRAVSLEDRLDLASVDAAGVVDVLEVRAVDLLLVEAHVVDEVLDAFEVDE